MDRHIIITDAEAVLIQQALRYYAAAFNRERSVRHDPDRVAAIDDLHDAISDRFAEVADDRYLADHLADIWALDDQTRIREARYEAENGGL